MRSRIPIIPECSAFRLPFLHLMLPADIFQRMNNYAHPKPLVCSSCKRLCLIHSFIRLDVPYYTRKKEQSSHSMKSALLYDAFLCASLFFLMKFLFAFRILDKCQEQHAQQHHRNQTENTILCFSGNHDNCRYRHRP